MSRLYIYIYIAEHSPLCACLFIAHANIAAAAEVWQGSSSSSNSSLCKHLYESVTLCLIISFRFPSVVWGPASRPQVFRIRGPAHLQMSGKEALPQQRGVVEEGQAHPGPAPKNK